MRYIPKTPFSQPTRDHHGTHQGNTAEDPPTVRPQHPLPAGSLPQAHPTPEYVAPPPTMETIHPSHTPPLTTRGCRTGATTRPRCRDPPTRGPRNRNGRAWPIHGAPRTTGPTQRWVDTPKHHTTTTPWLRHSSPTNPAPGDLRPHATPTSHGPRTETRQEDDQETARGCLTPPEDQPRATTRPTRPGYSAPPPLPGRPQHKPAPPYHTAPPPPHPGTWNTTAHHHRNEAAPRRLRTPPHRHHPWKPRTPHASSTPTTGHNPNRTQGQHHRPGQSPASSHTPQPRRTARFPEHRRTNPHRPPHVPRAPASHAHRAEASWDPLGHLGVTWGVYLCACKPPLADIILSHPPDLT